mmetsp:Transcript_51354/g.164184  ORF Transcript_51354/g.164184 Transcript_51354/m.164184 type:complete len:280 (+) Transcript_51354:778-1617(+)
MGRHLWDLGARPDGDRHADARRDMDGDGDGGGRARVRAGHGDRHQPLRARRGGADRERVRLLRRGLYIRGQTRARHALRRNCGGVQHRSGAAGHNPPAEGDGRHGERDHNRHHRGCRLRGCQPRHGLPQHAGGALDLYDGRVLVRAQRRPRQRDRCGVSCGGRGGQLRGGRLLILPRCRRQRDRGDNRWRARPGRERLGHGGLRCGGRRVRGLGSIVLELRRVHHPICPGSERHQRLLLLFFNGQLGVLCLLLGDVDGLSLRGGPHCGIPVDQHVGDAP